MTRDAAPLFRRDGPDSLWLHMLQSTLHQGLQQNIGDVQQRMARMLTGVRRYQTSTVPAAVRDYPVVWRAGAARMLHLPLTNRRARAHPVVLIPSLINGWEILDLLPQISMARYLANQQFDVYILDWGDVQGDEQGQTLERLLHGRLADGVAAVHAMADAPVTLMGYCMGGLLMAGAMPVVRDRVAAAVYLATPWNFHAGDPLLTRLVRSWVAAMPASLGLSDAITNSQVQALFAQVDPEMAIHKFARFADMAADDPALGVFIAVEDWLRSGRDLPASLARPCLNDWYLENRTGLGQWRVGGHAIVAATLASVPSYVVVPMRDRLVEPQTALPLATLIGGVATLVTPDMGHIGIMSSPRAKTQVWEGLAQWLRQTLKDARLTPSRRARA
jgi:polyhydroxyalkanoate synthase